MKEYLTIYEKGNHRWTLLYHDPTRPRHIIGTNEYVIQNGNSFLVTDPGGTEVFPEIISAIAEITDLENIKHVFCTHQDPDIFSSIALWLQIKPELKVYLSKIWLGFMLHFGGTKENFDLIPDEGTIVDLNSLPLQVIPAHYLHSSGNFHLYDPQAKILFTGDVGGAIIPDGRKQAFVEKFEDHLPFIEGFHRRWFSSNEHKNQWCERVSQMEIDFLCPQHGFIYKGDNVKRFVDWFYGFRVGIIQY